MKRLLTIIVLLMLLFNWIGYQFYATLTDQHASRTGFTKNDQRDFQKSIQTTGKMPSFHISFFVKDVDADDLLEFTSSPDNSTDETLIDMSTDLFADHANKENRLSSFKCFNGEYYSRLNKLFAKYPDAYSSGELTDRYLLKIPAVFISPKEHPPQHIG